MKFIGIVSEDKSKAEGRLVVGFRASMKLINSMVGRTFKICNAVIVSYTSELCGATIPDETKPTQCEIEVAEIETESASVYLAMRDAVHNEHGDYSYELFGVFATRQAAEAEVLQRYNKYENSMPRPQPVAEYLDILEYDRQEWRVDEEKVNQ